MTRSFIPAITSGPRPTARTIVYGVKPAARALYSRRPRTYFFDISMKSAIIAAPRIQKARVEHTQARDRLLPLTRLSGALRSNKVRKHAGYFRYLRRQRENGGLLGGWCSLMRTALR